MQEATSIDAYLNNTTECDHEIGRGMITHDGISHPGGEQFCFKCKLTIFEIVNRAISIENLAWRQGTRCMSCGREKQSELSDLCNKCIETE